jgi:hypothetical protein
VGAIFGRARRSRAAAGHALEKCVRILTLGGAVVLAPLPAAGAPVLTTSAGSTSYAKGSPPVVVDAALALADPAAPTFTGVNVRIASGLVPSEDELAFTAQGGVTGTYDAACGVLALTGAAPAATYESVLRSVTYQNTQSSNPR